MLESLVETGMVEPRGSKKGRSYLLSASVYRELGQPEAYVRARGFESQQMAQMILQYVQAHHRITRRDVVSLCRVNQNQAAYLLKKLVAQGHLHLVGAGRNAYYESKQTRNKLGKTQKNE